MRIAVCDDDERESSESPTVPIWSISAVFRRWTGTGSGRMTFVPTEGDHILAVETSSKLGYYSGMYFPLALGAAGTLNENSR